MRLPAGETDGLPFWGTPVELRLPRGVLFTSRGTLDSRAIVYHSQVGHRILYRDYITSPS